MFKNDKIRQNFRSACNLIRANNQDKIFTQLFGPALLPSPFPALRYGLKIWDPINRHPSGDGFHQTGRCSCS